jgi:hypothetical protein
MPLTLAFKKDGDVHARLGDQLISLVNSVEFKDDCFKGEMIGTIHTEDVNRRLRALFLDLRLRGSVLNGSLYAQSPRYALSHWAELHKAR